MHEIDRNKAYSHLILRYIRQVDLRRNCHGKTAFTSSSTHLSSQTWLNLKHHIISTRAGILWAMSLGRSFCNWRVSPSSKRLHRQMWLHRFDCISLSSICLRTILRDINTLKFVSVSAQCECRVRHALVVILCNHSLGDATVHEQKETSHVKQRNDSALLRGIWWECYKSMCNDFSIDLIT